MKNALLFCVLVFAVGCDEEQPWPYTSTPEPPSVINEMGSCPQAPNRAVGLTWDLKSCTVAYENEGPTCYYSSDQCPQWVTPCREAHLVNGSWHLYEDPSEQCPTKWDGDVFWPPQGDQPHLEQPTRKGDWPYTDCPPPPLQEETSIPGLAGCLTSEDRPRTWTLKSCVRETERTGEYDMDAACVYESTDCYMYATAWCYEGTWERVEYTTPAECVGDCSWEKFWPVD